MLRSTKNHSIYEVWCEYTAESVFVTHKPTKSELNQIIKEQQWPREPIAALHVNKLSPLYIEDLVKSF